MKRSPGVWKIHTGAIERLALCIAGRPVKDVVIVSVVLLTGTSAVGLIFSPPSEQVEKPKKLMNCCCPAAFRYTLPFADETGSEYALGRTLLDPDEVMQRPSDE